jgi:hypothetical protein
MAPRLAVNDFRKHIASGLAPISRATDSRESRNTRLARSPARLELEAFPNDSDIAAMTAAVTSGNG